MPFVCFFLLQPHLRREWVNAQLGCFVFDFALFFCALCGFFFGVFSPLVFCPIAGFFCLFWRRCCREVILCFRPPPGMPTCLPLVPLPSTGRGWAKNQSVTHTAKIGAHAILNRGGEVWEKISSFFGFFFGFFFWIGIRGEGQIKANFW